jgi:glyoxylase-like metal-dependent hydrolase (beta-lactamase superfamily II)
VAIVDVGSAADLLAVLGALDALGRSPAEVRFLLPTHLHFDHILGIEPLARRLGASVALGRVAAAHVLEGRALRWPPRRQLARALPTWLWQGLPGPPAEDLARARDFGFPWAENRFARIGPVLDDGRALPGFGGWRVLSTPGHADDAICLHHEAAGLLVAGDTVRNFCGGEWNPVCVDADDYARTRARLRSLRVTAWLPAHGPIVEGGADRIRTLPWFMP